MRIWQWFNRIGTAVRWIHRPDEYQSNLSQWLVCSYALGIYVKMEIGSNANWSIDQDRIEFDSNRCWFLKSMWHHGCGSRTKWFNKISFGKILLIQFLADFNLFIFFKFSQLAGFPRIFSINFVMRSNVICLFETPELRCNWTFFAYF